MNLHGAAAARAVKRTTAMSMKFIFLFFFQKIIIISRDSDASEVGEDWMSRRLVKIGY